MSLVITEEIIARQPPEAQAIIRLLLAEMQELKAEVAALRAELASVRKTPQNSSLPPSSQHPHAKPPAAPRTKTSKKKRGGQPGHPRHERALIPTEECQQVIACTPTACRRCGEKLSGQDPDPWRHQVWEMPEIKPLVSEYQRHRLMCPCCSETTCGELPSGVPVSQAGPRLVAFVALLMGSFRQSKRRVALFLEQVLQQPCSPGWVVKLQNQATTALTSPYEELKQQLPTLKHAAIDESPTKEGTKKAWVWTCVTQLFTVFTVRTTRAASVLDELLTSDFSGTISCDRAKMYWSLGQGRTKKKKHRLQWCWAHLTRDIQALIDSRNGQEKCLGRDLMRPVKEMFELWSRRRDGTLSHKQFQLLMKPIRKKVEALLLRGVYSGNKRLHGICSELHKHREWLWTFVDVRGIEPTNNISERALRHAVIWRKLSFGTQSARGSRFVETLLTVVESCRQQSRNAFDFITCAVQAHFARQSAPSLLPVA